MERAQLAQLVDRLLDTAPQEPVLRDPTADHILWLAKAATAINYASAVGSDLKFAELKRPVGAGTSDYPSLLILLESLRAKLQSPAENQDQP